MSHIFWIKSTIKFIFTSTLITTFISMIFSSSVLAAINISPNDICHTTYPGGDGGYSGIWLTTGKIVLCRPNPPALPVDVNVSTNDVCWIQRTNATSLLKGKFKPETPNGSGTGYKCKKEASTLTFLEEALQ